MKQNTASLRVVAELRERIRSGDLAPGDAVPSARRIVREFGVALATATKALALLRDEGLVRAMPGVGTIVRGERAPELSRARIVEAAISIADDEGTAALTMRSVARELGVATMSLYRHVPHKDALLVAMADAVLGEQSPPRAHRNGNWRAELEALARLQWDGYRRHRWLAPMLSMTRPQRLPNGMRFTDAVLAAIARLGFDDATTLASGISFIAVINGMAVGLQAEREAERDTGMDHDEWMRTQEAAFAPLLPRFPTLARFSTVETDLSLDAQFECVLAVVLDGLGARLGSRRSRDQPQ
ncbi:MAG TPA: TetR/AcrR family transcriptional regulator C-terminal domain-containing protein [Kofleriaceae bacterium]|jgi:AcrR family transcriptional regulator